MNYNEFVNNETINETLKRNVKLYRAKLDATTDPSTMGKQKGNLWECILCGSLTPTTTKTAVSDAGKRDFTYKHITFECKQGGSAFCNYDYETLKLTDIHSRGMFFAVGLNYHPDKPVEKVARFLPYYELVSFLYDCGKIRLKRDSQKKAEFKAMGLPHYDTQLAPQFDRLNGDEVDELMRISMSFDEFKEYAENRNGFEYTTDDLNNLFETIILDLVTKKANKKK